MKKTWKIPVTIEKCGLLLIEAETLEEAMKQVNENKDDNFYDKIIDEDYVDSSLHLSENDVDVVRECYNDDIQDNDTLEQLLEMA